MEALVLWKLPSNHPPRCSKPALSTPCTLCKDLPVLYRATNLFMTYGICFQPGHRSRMELGECRKSGIPTRLYVKFNLNFCYIILIHPTLNFFVYNSIEFCPSWTNFLNPSLLEASLLKTSSMQPPWLEWVMTPPSVQRKVRKGQADL